MPGFQEVYFEQRSFHLEWNEEHFHSWHRKGGGNRSFAWGKNTLQSKGIIRAARYGVHRKRRERSHLPINDDHLYRYPEYSRGAYIQSLY